MTRASKLLQEAKVIATEDLGNALNKAYNDLQKTKKIRDSLSKKVEKLFDKIDFKEEKQRNTFRTLNNELASAEDAARTALDTYMNIQNQYQAQVAIDAANK